MDIDQKNNLDTSVKEEVGTVTKLGVVLGMVGAFIVGMAMLVSLSPCTTTKAFAFSGSVPSVCRAISKPTPIQPLVVSDVTGGWTTISLVGTQQIDFRINETVIASMIGDQFGDISTDVTGPLNVQLYDSTEASTTFSEQIITLVTNSGTKALCIPKVEIVPNGAVLNKTIYLSSDGSAYNDAALTQRATTESCTTILSRAFSPTAIRDAASSRGFPTVDAHLAFRKNGVEISGMGALYQNDFSTSPNFPDLSKGPLVITPNDAPPASSFEARVLTVMTDSGTQGACLPQIDVLSDPEFVMPVFYVGKDGTTYRDVFLTDMATAETCATILARAFSPSVINDATSSAGFPNVDAGFQFFKNIVGSEIGMGVLYETDFSTSPHGPDVSKGPLVIVPEPSGSNPYPTFAARSLTLTTDMGSQNVCLPEIAISSDPEFVIPTFYVGADGTTYTDSLLSDVARSASECIPPVAYTPVSLSSVTFNQPYPTTHINVGFKRGDVWMGYATDGSWFTPTGTADPSNSSPLLISLSGTDQTFTAPERQVVVVSNLGTQALCIPQTQITGSTGSTIYYYDSNGKPYSDIALLQTIACGS